MVELDDKERDPRVRMKINQLANGGWRGEVTVREDTVPKAEALLEDAKAAIKRQCGED